MNYIVKFEGMSIREASPSERSFPSEEYRDATVVRHGGFHRPLHLQKHTTGLLEAQSFKQTAICECELKDGATLLGCVKSTVTPGAAIPKFTCRIPFS
eukprot:390273-Pelagomonas_calceolata.AAC.1